MRIIAPPGAGPEPSMGVRRRCDEARTVVVPVCMLLPARMSEATSVATRCACPVSPRGSPFPLSSSPGARQEEADDGLAA